MKKLIVLALMMPGLAFGQISYDFESGVLSGWTESVPGHWKADNNPANPGQFSLHHIFDNQVNGLDCIGLRINDLHPGEGDVTWSFSLRHGYDPSSSNNWNVFLMSDSDPASVSDGKPLNGFAIGVNLSGYDDTLKLWKIKNGTPEVIIKCPVNWQSNIGTVNFAFLLVTRSKDGIWTVIVSDRNGDQLGNGSSAEPELFATEWFIVSYRYTSTRDRLLWLDDLKIDGKFYSDVIAPVIKESVVTGRNRLKVFFDEQTTDEALLTANYLLNGTYSAISVKKITLSVYEVQFEHQFRDKVINTLLIRKICDINNNCTLDTLISFLPVWAEPGDIMISEIMADPLPAVGLPAKEYLELFNRTDYDLNFAGFRLISGEDSTFLPEKIIRAGHYLILCSSSDTLLFRNLGSVIGLKSFPALTDDGKILAVCDSSGILINGLEYSRKWYGDKLKENGGWSLELIDVSFPFFSDGNWKASVSRTGGTPGKENSVSGHNPDSRFSGIENVFPSDSRTLNISFSETIVHYEEMIENINVDDNPVTSILPDEPLQRRFIVTLPTSLDQNRIHYLTTGSALKDYAGNDPTRIGFGFGLTETAMRGDVVFNELLFNPAPDDPDFIEFYNGSENIIDAGTLYLASLSESGDTSGLVPVSAEQRCILPGAFFTISTDRQRILNKYFSSDSEHIFETARLPSMPDSRGHLLLLNRELDLIDEVIYSEEMHHPLLSTAEGISLEKVRPGISSMDPEAWHSASESSGWGTPGRENSVFSPFILQDDRITLSSGRLSPDNDGYEDVLVIDLNLEGTDNIVTITIYDETGGFVKRISENFLAGDEASVVWDGSASDGSLVRTGIYIILTEIYNPRGKTAALKNTCTVIRK